MKIKGMSMTAMIKMMRFKRYNLAIKYNKGNRIRSKKYK